MTIVPRLPPTSATLADDSEKPYFLWWSDLTCGQFRRKLREGTPDERAYWLGALLREANTRDVWLFTSVTEVRELWPHLYRHLGRSRALWSFLLQFPPPAEGSRVA
jgi:hypothetical protein